MSNYYYLVSSLPYLHFEIKPPISKINFEILLEENLLKNDLELIQLVKYPRPSINPIPSISKIFNHWQEWDLGVRRELSLKRAALFSNLKEDVAGKSEYTEYNLLADKILTQKNPFEAELLLSENTWNFLVELEVGHYFDIDFLILYYLKLQLLERIAQFDKSIGKKKVQKLLEIV